MNATNSPPPQPTARCAHYQPLLALLRTDALSSRDAARMNEHLAGCLWCQRELAIYDALDAAAQRYLSEPSLTPLTVEGIAQANGVTMDTLPFMDLGPALDQRITAQIGGRK